MRAMILAAGRGERLRPLTDNLAKSLVIVQGKSLIAHHLLALAALGVKDIVINVCYRSEQVMHTLGDGSAFGVNIHYSLEETMLGVGGGVVNAKSMLGDEPFILISADIFTDFPLRKLKLSQPFLGHIVVVDNPPHHPDGDFSLNHGIISITGSPKWNYAGIALLHPQLLRGLLPTPQGFMSLIESALAKQLISGEHYQGVWHNIGSVVELEAANQVISM